MTDPDDTFLDDLISDAASDDGDASGMDLLQPMLQDAARARTGGTLDPDAIDRLFTRSSVGGVTAAPPSDLPLVHPVEDRHTGTYAGWPRWLAPLGGLLVALLAIGGVWAILATDGGPSVVPVADPTTEPTVSETPSAAPSPSPTPSPTPTPTPTPTETEAPTPTATATPTPTATQTVVAAPVTSPSPTPSPRPTPSPSRTPSPTPSPAPPPPASPSPSPSPSPTAPPPTAVAPPPSSSPTPEPTATSQPVSARNDAASTSRDTAVTVNVLANDSPQASLDRGSLQVTGSPGNGTASVSSGSVRYTPSAGFTGSDSFTYRICTTSGSCGSATASISVSGGRSTSSTSTTTFGGTGHSAG